MALPPGVLRLTTIGWDWAFNALPEDEGLREALQPCQYIETNIHIFKHNINKLYVLISCKFNRIYILALNLLEFIN
jgi:hypothetical protein